MNKPIEDTAKINIYKDGKLVEQSEHVLLSVEKLVDEITCEDKTKIKLIIPYLKPEDSGEYQLVLKDNNEDRQLASSKLKVEATPKPIIKCLNPVKSEKPELVQGDELVLSLKLSQAIENSDDCILWELNGKPLDLNNERIEKVEDIVPNGEYQYSLKVSNVQLGVHDGEYSVKVKQAPESNDLVYSGSTKVSIKPKPLEITDSNWQHDVNLNEGDQLELNLSIDRDASESESIVLYKNNVKIAQPNLKTSLNDGKTEIKVILPNLSESDSGDYTLSLENASKKQKIELASTHLDIIETPLEILEPLKSDKQEYFIGEEVKFTFTTSKSVENKEKCIEWLLNGKSLSIVNDLKIQFIETKNIKNNSAVYSLTITDVQINKNDGEYTVKIR